MPDKCKKTCFPNNLSAEHFTWKASISTSSVCQLSRNESNEKHQIHRIHRTALSTLIPRNCQTMVTKSSSSANSFSTERTESLLTNTVSLISRKSGVWNLFVSKKCCYFKYSFPTKMIYHPLSVQAKFMEMLLSWWISCFFNQKNIGIVMPSVIRTS